MSGCHKKNDGSKWTYEEINNGKLFQMYKSRCKKQDAKRSSSFLREHKVSWKVKATCSNAADKIITATHIALDNQAEFAGQLSNTGGNLDLIDYVSNKLVTNTMFLERLRKGISDYLDMKENFEVCCDFLRATARDMDDKGKGNNQTDQIRSPLAPAHRTPYAQRGRGSHAATLGHGRRSYHQQRGGFRGRRHQLEPPAGRGRGHCMRTLV